MICEMRVIAFVLLCSVAYAEEKPVLSQAAGTAGRSQSAAVTAGERSASGAAVAFGEKTDPGAVPLNKTFKPAPVAPLTAAPVQPAAGTPPGPKTYAAAAAEKEAAWDREGTLKAGAVGMAGALIGFMLGGPIGAAAGFLAAFFVGAALWKFGKI